MLEPWEEGAQLATPILYKTEYFAERSEEGREPLVGQVFFSSFGELFGNHIQGGKPIGIDNSPSSQETIDRRGGDIKTVATNEDFPKFRVMRLVNFRR